MILKGLDLSHHNGKVDFTKLKGKVDFCIIHCGYGRETNQKDSMFETYYKGCKDNDIPVGVYFYSYATTPADAVLEAKNCYSWLRGKQFEYPVYFDIEHESQVKLSKTVCSAITDAWCSTMEQYGYYVGVYSMDSFFSNNLVSSIQDKYTCWTARVENVKPTYCKKYDMWQYSWKGKFTATTSEVDLDYCYKDFPTLIKKLGKNGYTAAKVETTVKPVVTANKYGVPDNITLYTSMDKNVISTFSYSKHGNIKLSDHFKVSEMASKQGTKLYSEQIKVHNKLIEILEALYAKLNCSKIIVNSGYRTSEHEKAIGGNSNGISQHTLGRAADIVCYAKGGNIIPSKKVCCTLEDMGVLGIGYISNKNITTHVDTRTTKWFGDETTGLSIASFHKYFNM